MNVSEILAAAKDHQQAARLDEAERLYASILDCDPSHHDALHRLGLLNYQRGRPEDAIELIARAINERPDLAYLHANLGVAQLSTGRLADALVSFDIVIGLTPEDAEAYFNRGNALRGLGRVEEARDAYQRAVDIQPQFAQAHTNLGALLRAAGQLPQALLAFTVATQADPSFAPAQFNLGVTAGESGDLARAHAALLRAIQLSPEVAPSHFQFGVVARSLGRLEEASAAFARASQLQPDLIEAHRALVGVLEERQHEDATPARSNLGGACLIRGDPTGALDAYEINLHSQGHDGATAPPIADLAHRAIALRELGQLDPARAIVDHRRLIRRRHLEPPPGYADLDAFNRSLADHILRHPTLASDPRGHSTRGGHQTRELLDAPQGPMVAFARFIEDCVQSYIDELTPDSTHPYLARAPSRRGLTAWGVVLGAGGHQVPHIHPDGWLSGNYYVELPDAVNDPDATAGWLEFGRPDPSFDCQADPQIELIQPQVGTMVLFPSYFYHCTIPFNDDHRRISIAFDAMPIFGESS